MHLLEFLLNYLFGLAILMVAKVYSKNTRLLKSATQLYFLTKPRFELSKVKVYCNFSSI